jgi:hypothetical protein
VAAFTVVAAKPLWCGEHGLRRDLLDCVVVVLVRELAFRPLGQYLLRDACV